MHATSDLYALLAEVADAAVRADSEQGLYDQICWTLTTTGGLRLAWIASDGEPTVVASAGGGSAYLAGFDHRPHTGEPALAALSEGRTVVVGDVNVGDVNVGDVNVGDVNVGDSSAGHGSADSVNAGAATPRHSLGPDRVLLVAAGIASVAALPILTDDAVIGAFALYSADAGYFDAERVGLFERLVATMSFSINSLRSQRASEEARVRLATSEERFRALLEHSADAIAVSDSHGRLEYLSPSFHLATGEGARPDNVTGLFEPADAEVVRAAIGRSASLADERVTAEASSGGSGAGHRAYQLVLTNHLEDPAVDGIVVNIRDVTEAREAEAELRRLALHDSLTGLANRSLLLDRIAQSLSRLGLRSAGLATQGAGVLPQAPGILQGSSVALLHVDLDRFKQVNDRLGHATGDDVLREVARRLQDCAGATDTVARLASDEFVILVDDLRDESELPKLAQRVRRALEKGIDSGGINATLTASIGMAVGAAGALPADLLQAADVAMLRAKAAGGDRFEVYDEAFGRRLADRAALEMELRRALDRDELVVAYHPIISLHTGKVKALEALVRWNHPERGLVQPDDFVPLAEETGLVIPLGLSVLGKAARQVVEWSADGTLPPEVWVSVNVSARQLQLPDFPELVTAVVAEAGATPSQVLLELTETVLGEDMDLGAANAERLRKAGFGLAVDDFGTGYASLSQLKRFPVHTLKVDKGFVSGLGTDPNDTSIVTAVLSLAQSFGIPTVAEGVETEAHSVHLARLGCDSLQGYLFTKPLLGPAATEWLRSRDVWVRPDGTLAGW